MRNESEKGKWNNKVKLKSKCESEIKGLKWTGKAVQMCSESVNQLRLQPIKLFKQSLPRLPSAFTLIPSLNMTFFTAPNSTHPQRATGVWRGHWTLTSLAIVTSFHRKIVPYLIIEDRFGRLSVYLKNFAKLGCF